MERRDVLKSASTLAAASTVGLAGCGGILGGGCSKPKDDFKKSMPDSDDYKGEVSTGSGEGSEDIKKTASGFYEGPDGNGYYFVIIEFSSKDVASEKAKNASSNTGSSSNDGAAGYIVTGKYGYTAGGPSKEKVKTFMKTSPTLSDGCVDNNVEFV